MLLGGFGERAADAVERVARERGLAVERSGSLAVAGARRVPGSPAWIGGRLVPADRPAASGPGGQPRWTTAQPAELAAALRGILIVPDEPRGGASVVRDALGSRTLVHARLGDDVLFAEHERDLLSLLPRAPEPDRLALIQWIERRTLPPRRSLYAGLSRLPAGHRLALLPGRAVVERWWEPTYRGTLDGGAAEVAEQLRGSAFAAVTRAADASRRLGVRLSGGLDSACVAAAVAGDPGRLTPALALAATFPTHPETDERALIEATAKHVGMPLERVPAGAERLLGVAIEHLLRWRLPPGSPNLVVWEQLARVARAHGIDLLLDGEGGDELFGLTHFLIAERVRRGRLAAAWRLAGELPGMGDRPGRRVRLRALRDLGVEPSLPAALRRRRAGGDVELVEGADARALAAIDDRAGWRALAGPLWWRAHADGLVNDADALDAHGHLRRQALDGGVEYAHPFLHDPQLVEAALAIPPRLQFDPRRDRPLLRDALAGLVPEQVRTRTAKSYFTSLSTSALWGPDGAALARRLARADAPIRAYVRADALERLLERRSAPPTPAAAALLWRVATTDAWLAAHADPAALDDLREPVEARRG